MDRGKILFLSIALILLRHRNDHVNGVCPSRNTTTSSAHSAMSSRTTQHLANGMAGQFVTTVKCHQLPLQITQECVTLTVKGATRVLNGELSKCLLFVCLEV